MELIRPLAERAASLKTGFDSFGSLARLGAPGAPEALIRQALREDGRRDLTTRALGIRGRARGVLMAKASGVLAGAPLFEAVLRASDRRVNVKWRIREGSKVRKGQVVAMVNGSAPALLRSERPALNILQHLSGIASLTRRYVEAVRGNRTKILDTRKTLPGLRAVEKYAVKVGGGTNHRLSLADGILVKDNHLRFVPSVGEAARRAVRKNRKAQIEVNTFVQLKEAVGAGAKMVLLDNFPPAVLRKALKWATEGSPRGTPKGSGRSGKVITEVSGGMTLAKAHQAARWGADRISIGSLTHSAPALDFSLELFPE